MTIEQMLMMGVSGLTMAVVFMFKHMISYEKECREDRRYLWERVSALQSSSCGVEGCALRQPAHVELTHDAARRAQQGR